MEAVSIPAILLAAVINAILGGVVLVNSNRNKENRLFILIILGTILWPLTLFYFLKAQGAHNIQFATQLAYLSAAYIPYIFTIFCLEFIKSVEILSGLLAKILLGVPFLVVIGIIFFDANFITNPHFDALKSVNTVEFGSGYLLYLIYIVAYFSFSFGILAYKYLGAQEKSKKLQLAFVFAGTVLATMPAVFADLILPWTGNFLYNWAGPASTIIMVGFISYAIFKHHLFEAKIVTTEIFTAILLILLFLNIFSQEPAGGIKQIFSIVVFVVAAGFGWLLIRSVLFEVSSREKIAKLAKQLQTANEKLQQVDKVKTEFISIASHQLRTPLTIIKGYTSMALEGTFGRYTKQQHEVMDKLFQSANRLINLVEDLLNISRLEQGRIEYEYKVIDPVALVRGVVEELEQKAKTHIRDLAPSLELTFAIN